MTQRLGRMFVVYCRQSNRKWNKIRISSVCFCILRHTAVISPSKTAVFSCKIEHYIFTTTFDQLCFSLKDFIVVRKKRIISPEPFTHQTTEKFRTIVTLVRKKKLVSNWLSDKYNNSIFFSCFVGLVPRSVWAFFVTSGNSYCGGGV